MKILRRTKPSQDGGPPAVHFVTSINDSGHVLGLSPDRSEAAPFDDAAAAKVLSYHAARENAGRFEALTAK